VKIAEMNWMQVEDYLRTDNRAVVPLGSTEQHSYLSLCADSILAERVAIEAAAELNVPVFPVLSYGITPYFRAFPGTVTLRVETYARVVSDLLDGLAEQGFRRILFVNGHGGNLPAQSVAGEWVADHPACRVKFHSWWNAPRVWAKVTEIDPVATHASWMENYLWTRLPGVLLPAEQKAPLDAVRARTLSPKELRTFAGDGSYGGHYQRSDAEMQSIWTVGVQETRDVLEYGWGPE
jgi:creatinine amidohydrolase